jgi:hypothetical protein
VSRRRVFGARSAKQIGVEGTGFSGGPDDFVGSARGERKDDDAGCRSAHSPAPWSGKVDDFANESVEWGGSGEGCRLERRDPYGVPLMSVMEKL